MSARSICIIGSGLAAWLAASLLKRALTAADWSVSVVGLADSGDSLGLPLTADCLSPRALELLARFGWSEHTLIAHAGGAAALGFAMSDWASEGAHFRSFGSAGAPMGPVAFHQLAARLRLQGKSVNFANYALGALCAQANRFAPPDADDRSVLSTLTYGLHVDSVAFTALLRADTLARGVRLIDGGIFRVERDAQGGILQLATQHGDITADLFVDCSGPLAHLCADAKRLDWSSVLPIDRVVISRKSTQDGPASYAHIAAHATGWQRFTAIQRSVEEAFAYQSGVAAEVSPDARHVDPGRLITPWHGNRVAIGGAAAVIDPLVNPQLELAVSAIAQLIELLPATDDCRAEARMYNRQITAGLDSARDVAAAAYALNARAEPFWEQCRSLSLPEPLAYKISLFRHCGRIAQYDDEIYAEEDWVAYLDALGLRAAQCDAQANALSTADIEAHFARIRQVMLAAVRQLPPHDVYLRSLNR